MQAQHGLAVSGECGEPGHVVGRPDRIGQPREVVDRVLPGVRQNTLGEVLRVFSGPPLLLDELGHRDCGVEGESGVVVHMQDPDILARLALGDPQLVAVVVGPSLEAGPVRCLI